ncbi:cytochrome P450 [Whalleya microplaca]|nr:cytochrome P450 [Whalleya microplaca]
MEIDNVKAMVSLQLHGFALYSFIWLWASLSSTWRNVLLSLTVFISFRYAWVVLRYRRARRHYHIHDNGIERVPPTYPTLMPFLGSSFYLMWDTALFNRIATSYRGELTSTRISLLGSAIYMFQDRETVCKIMRQRSYLTPIAVRFVFPAKSLFGMPEDNGLDAYRVDDSGPLERARAGSNIPSQDRIDYLHHQAFQRAFMGPGLTPITLRFRASIRAQVTALSLNSPQWTEVGDLFALVGKLVSAAITEAIFGPSLLQLHPDFIDNMWAYDGALPWLVRMIPRWINPQPHRARDKVLEQIKEWHIYARQGFQEDNVEPDRDSDPFWGSEMVRHLHKVLVESKKHSNDAMSAHDLGLIWGAAALATFHIFADPDLLSRVRAELEEHLPHLSSPSSFEAIGTKQFNGLPLLSSIYAETLRLYSNVFLMVASPPDTDVPLGKWKFPRRSFGLVSTALAHTDKRFWNTKDDAYPVDTFWADRFLVYREDPESGPIRPEFRADRMNWQQEERNFQDKSRSNPRYSTEGLEGSWLPYGAGVGMCPGRFLSKDVIISTCALLVSEYDIETLTESLDMDPWRFGLSLGRPRSAVAARIRKRR